jgi:hypothetical protein
MVAQVVVAVKLGTIRQVQEVCAKAQAQQDKCCDDDDPGSHEKLHPSHSGRCRSIAPPC